MSNEIFPKKPWKYSFDTSAFIDSYKRYYPMDIFPKLWKFLERIINNQIIVVSIMVQKEINYQNDDLTSFINKFSNLFISPDKNMQHYVKILINNDKFRKWSIDNSNEADPFVVALAKVFNLIVVSYENPRAITNKIPAACRELGVQHFTFIDFLREEKYQD